MWGKNTYASTYERLKCLAFILFNLIDVKSKVKMWALILLLITTIIVFHTNYANSFISNDLLLPFKYLRKLCTCHSMIILIIHTTTYNWVVFHKVSQYFFHLARFCGGYTGPWYSHTIWNMSPWFTFFFLTLIVHGQSRQVFKCHIWLCPFL